MFICQQYDAMRLSLSSRRDIFGDTKEHEQEETSSSGKRGSRKGNHKKNGKSVNIVPGTGTSAFCHSLCVTQMASIHFLLLK
jgi:hypothetical protein